MNRAPIDLEGLPGEELITKGLRDLCEGVLSSPEALLVAIVRTKLTELGVEVPASAFEVEDAELRLYATFPGTTQEAYREYKSLTHRLGKFERALQGRVLRREHSGG